MPRAGAEVEGVFLIVEIDINAGMRLEGIADAFDVLAVDAFFMRPERDDGDEFA